MGFGYVAYIDEAGDDGLQKVKPLDPNGASEWLILSAVVVRADREPEIPRWVEEIATRIRHRQQNQIHFKSLNDATRTMACRQLANRPVRLFAIASNKKNMKGYRNPFAEKIPSQCWFYCWLTRLLLERVTHFVKNRSTLDFGEIKKLKIVFAKRGGFSYSQLGAYFEWLKLKSSGNALVLPLGDLEWSVMDRNFMFVAQPINEPGLQLADVVAGAFFKGCDVYDTKSCDPKFAELLRQRIARWPDTNCGQISGYGIKLMPAWRKARLRQDQQKIFHSFGYPQQWWRFPKKVEP